MKFAYASGSQPLTGYTIKRGIGMGGFGEVYFATSEAGKEVALKRIQRNMDVELRGVRQCLNLKHANLIALWDIQYDDQNQAWVVMEYVCGESLKDVVDRHPGGMPSEQVHAWFKGIAAGVGYLHDHGIVHRDLKPGNIFEDEDVVKIGDYGLSKFISCSRRSGQTESVGTFHYMAPEIGKGSYGKEIDIYALGIILYEMLTGEVPFDGESSQEIMMKHLTADPDLSSVAQPYRRVIQKAMAKDPEQRYSNVNRMLEDLDLDSIAGTPQREKQPHKPSSSAPPLVITDATADTLFISDDEPDEIRLGDVTEVVDAEPIPGKPRKDPPNSHRITNDADFHTGPQPEPIALAVRGGWSQARQWWRDTNTSTPLKVGLLIVGAIVLILNASWLIPLCAVCGLAYFIYYGSRSLAMRLGRSDSSSGIQVEAIRDATVADATPRLNRKEFLQRELAQRTVGERLSELTGSFLMSAFVSAVLCLVMVVVDGNSAFEAVKTWSMYAWLVMTSVAGAWLVLTVSTLLTGDKSENMKRRFFMLVTGLVLGAAAFGFSVLLAVPIEFERARPFGEVYDLPASMVSSSNLLLLPGYLAFFGGLFFVLSWWKQTDPLRRSRLSLWATTVCVLWALIIDVFPTPWGFMLAATISVAVQLSAPWLTPKQRAEIHLQHQES